MIFSLVLIIPGPIVPHEYRLLGTQLDVSILCVSKLIFQQASSIFFGQNYFKACYPNSGFRYGDSVRELLDPGFLGEGFLRYARELTIDWPRQHDVNRLGGFLEELQSIATLRIRVRDFIPRPLLGQTFTFQLLKLRGLENMQIQTDDRKYYDRNIVKDWTELEKILKKVVTSPKINEQARGKIDYRPRPQLG